MSLTNQEYKDLSIKEFTTAAKKYETANVSIYKMCRKDYPDILAEIEKEPFDSLLDAGCGPAPMITLLSEKYPDKKYTGIDLTPAMIDMAKAKNIQNATFIVGDCENLPFEANSFDVIICSMSAHHYPEIQNFFDACYKCLKPNGRLILRDMTTDNKLIAWFGSNIEMPLAHLFGHGDVDMLKRDQCKIQMEKAGLVVIVNELRKGMRLHMVARKPA